MNTKLLLILAPIGLLVLFQSTYMVQETEQVIITQFGDLNVTDPVTEAGLHFKLPFIQQVNRIEKRFLPWDGPADDMPDKKKDLLIIDTFARWKISDAKLYFTKLGDERSARSRLDDILGSETQNAVAKHEIIEMVRTDKDRMPALTDEANASQTKWEPITIGRKEVQQVIFEAASPQLKNLGIELLDLRFKRINYHESVLPTIYDRMKAERKSEAEKWRNEGEAEVKRIEGERERELKTIESEAYRKVEEIKGEADANATRIYAEAYSSSKNDDKEKAEIEIKQRVELYTFLKTLETYEQILTRDTSLILTTDSPLFQLLKTVNPQPLKEPHSFVREADDLIKSLESISPPKTAAE
jgi:modulator of FtsH protease HflC